MPADKFQEEDIRRTEIDLVALIWANALLDALFQAETIDKLIKPLKNWFCFVEIATGF